MYNNVQGRVNNEKKKKTYTDVVKSTRKDGGAFVGSNVRF